MRTKTWSISIAILAAAVAAGGGIPARAEPKYAGWTKVEASREIREIKEKLKEGGQLDGNAKAFLEGTVLPQLAVAENRPMIERTRKRIRDSLLADVSDDKAYGDIALLVADSMTTLARDDQADAVVRVNAMLLVGELKAKDGRPWPGAASSLAAVAGDKALPDAVRIAALVGIAKHLEKGGGGEGADSFRTALTSILGEPLASDRAVEQEWLLSRALQMVPMVAKPIPPKLAPTIASLVADDARSIDVRVRAAAALGTAADATSGVDAAAVVEMIRKIAVTSLEAEEQAATARRFEEQYRRGGAAPGMVAGPPPGVGFDGQPLPVVDPAAPSEQACRRAAWRLYTLGTAIATADGKQGLAALMGEAGGPAKDLAKQLVDEALLIDQTPDEDALLDALDALRPPQPGEKRAARQPKADAPKEGDAKPDGTPNTSPFDNPFR